MLSTLIVDNFKAFGRRQVIPLAPITLIVGENSGGKSSLLQTVLALKQTIDDTRPGGSPLVPRGDLVDLGGFQDLVFKHDLTRTVEISLLSSRAPRPAGGSRRDRGWLGADGPSGLGLRVRFDEEKRSIAIESLPMYLHDPNHPICLWSTGNRYSHFQNVPRSALQQTDPAVGPPRIAVIAEIDETHPLWASEYETFASEYLEKVRHALDWLVLFFSSGPDHVASRPWESLPPTLKTDSLGTYSNYADLAVSIEAYAYPEDSEHEVVLSDGETTSVWIEESTNLKRNEESVSSLLTMLQTMRHRFAEYDLHRFIEDTTGLSTRRSYGLQRFLLSFPASPSHYSRDQRILQEVLRFIIEPRRLDPTSYLLPNLGSLAFSLSRRLQHDLESVTYLGPLREYPERYYIFSGNASREVGKSGRLLPDILFTRRPLVEETNRKLQEFGVGYELDVRRLRDADRQDATEDVFALRLLDSQTSTPVSLLDVGFGVSQVLPVIVQSLLSRRNTILIEQPEIHLHPRLQAELGSLFADGIADPRRNQFIVETHSEHLLLRVQRLIRDGTLSPSDVSVIYVSHDETGSWTTRLRLDADGDFIDEWPGGFFEEGYRELFS